MATVTEAVTARSSTRGYTSEPLTEEEITRILEAGLKAPTGNNKQEIHFTVLSGEHKLIQELEAEKNRMRNLTGVEHNFCYEAPTLIILSAQSDYRWSVIDAGIAVENMALTAEELGLGSLIIGSIYDAMHGEKQLYFEEKLELPDGYEFQIALAVGHKAVTKEPHTYSAEAQITYLS